jgi:YfiH family protein
MARSALWPDGLACFPLEGTPAFGAFTRRRDGDARTLLSASGILHLRQVHGAKVLWCEEGLEPLEGPLGEGDALASADPVALAVLVADCVPVLLASENGVVAAVHCGWRSLAAGILPGAVSTMFERGAGKVVAAVGPCICPRCYEFGEADLSSVAGSLGLAEEDVSGVSRTGRPSLDLRACVHRVLEEIQVDVVYEEVLCTSCDSGFFSARAHSDTGRQAGIIWSQPSQPRKAAVSAIRSSKR